MTCMQDIHISRLSKITIDTTYCVICSSNVKIQGSSTSGLYVQTCVFSFVFLILDKGLYNEGEFLHVSHKTIRQLVANPLSKYNKVFIKNFFL